MNWQPNTGTRPQGLADSDKVHVRLAMPDGSTTERLWPVTSRLGAIQWSKDRPVAIREWSRA